MKESGPEEIWANEFSALGEWREVEGQAPAGDGDDVEDQEEVDDEDGGFGDPGWVVGLFLIDFHLLRKIVVLLRSRVQTWTRRCTIATQTSGRNIL
ncbi:MAG: hypothetical protein ABSG02_19560 [Terriglobales bacterium]